MPLDMRHWATTGAELWEAALRRIAKCLVLVIAVIVLVSGYLTGYGWLIQEDRWPPERSGKGGGGTYRYQTLRGVRIAYYLGDCPTFSTTRFPDKEARI